VFRLEVGGHFLPNLAVDGGGGVVPGRLQLFREAMGIAAVLQGIEGHAGLAFRVLGPVHFWALRRLVARNASVRVGDLRSIRKPPPSK